MNIVQAKDLTFEYIIRDDEDNIENVKTAVDHVSLDIEQGQFIAILGHNGSGKSTFAKHINALLSPTEGSIWVDGMDTKDTDKLWDIRQTAGMVFQNPDNQIIGTIVEEDVGFGPENLGVPADEIWKRVEESLKDVGMLEYRKSSPNKLSGGQKQRVGIARALTTDPELLLCDEATSALDPQTTESILKLLKKINRKMGVTILLITHQMQVVQMICNKVAVMESGKIVESGSVLEVFGSPKMPVTKRFVQTVIRDQIPDSIISLVKEQKENFRVDRLKFIGSSVKRPVISDICKTKGVVVNILGAAVQELEDSVMCVFILQLIGDDESIDKAEAEIDKNGVLRERLEVE